MRGTNVLTVETSVEDFAQIVAGIVTAKSPYLAVGCQHLTVANTYR